MRGAAVSMWSAAASRASRGALPAYAKVNRMNASCGRRCSELFRSAAPIMSSQRMSASRPSADPSMTFESWVTLSRQQSRSRRVTLGLPTHGKGGGCLLPSLIAGDCKHVPYWRDRGAKGKERATLLTILPTLTARDWRSGCASAATLARNSRPLSEALGGMLHPDFCEWYQGMPMGWTRGSLESGRLATRRFRRWLQRHFSS